MQTNATPESGLKGNQVNHPERLADALNTNIRIRERLFIISLTNDFEKKTRWIKSKDLYDPNPTSFNRNDAIALTQEDAEQWAIKINFNGHYTARIHEITPSFKAATQRRKIAKWRIKTIIQASENPQFITLTQDPKKYDATDANKLRQAIKNCMRGAESKMYYAAFEQHKKGNWHAHIVADEKTAEHIQKKWKRGFYYIEPIKSSYIRKDGQIQEVANEMTKYVEKYSSLTKPMTGRDVGRTMTAKSEVSENNRYGRFIDHGEIYKERRARQWLKKRNLRSN